MWHRCGRWKKPTPGEIQWACCILNTCTACEIHLFSRHMSHVGIWFCVIAGLGFDWAARNMYVSLIFFLTGFFILMLPHALDGTIKKNSLPTQSY